MNSTRFEFLLRNGLKTEEISNLHSNHLEEGKLLMQFQRHQQEYLAKASDYPQQCLYLPLGPPICNYPQQKQRTKNLLCGHSQSKTKEATNRIRRGELYAGNKAKSTNGCNEQSSSPHLKRVLEGEVGKQSRRCITCKF